MEKNKGFIKEILIIAVVVFLINYFGYSVQEVADWFKKIFQWFLDLI